MDTTSPPPPFGVLLRRLRVAAGLSQEELAERARLSVQAVSALERGARRAPYRDTIELLADALTLTDEDRAQLHATVSRRRRPATPTQPDAAHSNLPSPATSFVGREQEQATVLRLLDSTRLLTLTGTGGIGKTRLATHVATGATDPYPDGVHLVELAPLADPTLIPQTVAQTLGVREAPGTPLLETLVAALREQRLLLLLDNCEHLLRGAGELVETLLRACPHLRILATSREALGVTGETVWWVPSLPVPEPDRATGGPPRHTAESAIHAESAQLFCARAATAHPAFTLTDTNASAVAAVCRRLDGIPLALELAAARARILTPEQIAARLDARFRLLTRGNEAALPRHQTLRAVLDWSYDLLIEPERHLLAQLSIFAGGCDLEAAEAICLDGEIEQDALVDLLHNLVEKSLVTVEYRGETARYHLLETVREYAAERLDAADETGAVPRRYLDWALDLAERASPQMEGPEQMVWLDRLDVEHDNLRAVLQWTLHHDQAALGLQIAGQVGMFWQRRGLLTEGRQRFEQLLAHGPNAPIDVRALALLRTGMLAEQQGAFDDATRYVEQSLELFRETGDQRRIGGALSQLGSLAWRRSDFARSTACFEESLAIARKIDSLALVSRCLNSLGILAVDQGWLETGHDYFEEALAITRTLGDAAAIAIRMNNLAMVSIRLGDLPQARVYAEEALAIHRQHGHKDYIANDLRRLAEILLDQGESDAALRCATEALAVAQEIGNQFEVAEALDHLARIALERSDTTVAGAHARGSLRLAQQLGTQRQIWMALDRLGQIARRIAEHDRALRLFAAACAVRASTGEISAESAERDVQDYLADLRSRFSEAIVDAAWNEGYAMSRDQAIAYALAETASPATPTPSPGYVPRPPSGPA